MFDDDGNQVLHSLDTDENTVVGSYLVGSGVGRLFLPDEGTAIVVKAAENVFGSDDVGAPGSVVIVDLAKPMSVPDLLTGDAFARLLDATFDADTEGLIFLSSVVLEETTVDGPFRRSPACSGSS